MGIGAINPYNFTSNMRISDIPKIDAEQLKQQQVNKPDEAANQSKPAITIEPVEDKRPRSLDPNSVSLTANKQETFDYIGSEKDINRLDMQKAISQMHQDSILKDYNYFVGNASNVYNSEDGMVISKL